MAASSSSEGTLWTKADHLPLAGGRSLREVLVFGQWVQQLIRLAQAVAGEAAPAVVARRFDHAGAEGVGLDVAEDRQQMVVVLNDGALEPTLPDVAAAVVASVVALGVGDEQALHDPADRGLQGANQQVHVIGHEAIAIELERPALLQVADRLQECLVIPVVEEDRCAVVAAIDDVVDETVADRSKWSGHEVRIAFVENRGGR